MKRRIRIIFLLMGACILGINLFQGYWLYNSYRDKRQEFTKSATEALFQALRRQEVADVDRALGPKMVRRHLNEISFKGSKGSARVTFFGRDSTGNKIMVFDTTQFQLGSKVMRIEMVGDSMAETSHAMPPQLRARLAADTLARNISNMLVLSRFYERDFNLGRFDSLYRSSLADVGIQAMYRLDTLRMKPPTVDGPVFIDLEKSDSSGLLRTTLAPVNLLSNLFIRATFPNPYPLILGRMTGLLAGSFLLFLLTTGCLIYMLRTILAQKRLSEIKSDFINNMTHELKTPIATVSAAVEALQHFNALHDQRKLNDYLDISQQELRRLSDLVEKVLNIAVEERRELELYAEPVDVIALIEKILETHRIKAGRPLQLRLEHSLHENPIARVDRTHFANAINNLIDNAIKYSFQEVNVLVQCRRENGWLQVSVRDSGIGIARENQQAIFEQFFRVPRGDLHEVKGFGLGLSYVKRIIEKHGGRITVSSELNKGSEFVIAIPA